MEMNQIRYFLAVCEHRNFTHAAKASHVSQPSLTAAIKKLEVELGGPLFLRDRAGCRLTALGNLVRPRLERIQSEALEVKVDAVRHIRLDRVPVCIGLGETIGTKTISEAIERFRKRCPQADIELLVDSHIELLEALHEGRSDLVISSSKVNADLYRIKSLYKEKYKVVVSKNHPFGNMKSLSLEQLAQSPVLDRPNCEMRDILDKTCTEKGLSLYAAYRSNRVDWLLELARNGSGLVILPVTAIPLDSELVALEIDGLDIEREVSLIQYPHQPTRSDVNALLDELIRSA